MSELNVLNCPLVTGLRPCQCEGRPRCPRCNYSDHDAAFENDHHICDGTIGPPAAPPATGEAATGIGCACNGDEKCWNHDGSSVDPCAMCEVNVAENVYLRTQLAGRDERIARLEAKRPNGLTFAPWTLAQVAALNHWQDRGDVHEFTCGTEACRAALVATPEGWTCHRCSYTQDWAHNFMIDIDAVPNVLQQLLNGEPK